MHRFAQVKRQDSPKCVTLANARYSVALLLTILVTQTMAVKHRLIYQKTAKAVFFHLWRVLPPFVKAGFHEFFNRIKLKGKFAPFFETLKIRKILILRKARRAVERRKNKRSLFRANSRLHEPVTLAKCSLFRSYAPYNSCHGGKTLPYSRKRIKRFLFLRQVFPYSQKVTQAELFARCSLHSQ